MVQHHKNTDLRAPKQGAVEDPAQDTHCGASRQVAVHSNSWVEKIGAARNNFIWKSSKNLQNFWSLDDFRKGGSMFSILW